MCLALKSRAVQPCFATDQGHGPTNKSCSLPGRLTLLAALLSTQLAWAQSVAVVAIGIPAQPLAAELPRFAEQTGLKTLYAAELLAGKVALAV